MSACFQWQWLRNDYSLINIVTRLSGNQGMTLCYDLKKRENGSVQVYFILEPVIEMILKHMIRNDRLHLQADLVFQIPFPELRE